MKIITFTFIIFAEIVFCNGMFSELDQSSVYFDFSNYYDNVSYINADSELDDSAASLQKVIFGYVLKGKYDLSFKLINNKTAINNFNYPYNKNIYAINFNYLINDLIKIPLNFSVGHEYVYADDLFNYNSIHMGAYFDFIVDEYPSVAYLKLTNINNLDLEEYSDNVNAEFGTNIKLVVDKKDNSLLKDIIFLGINLSTSNFKKYNLGLNIGLYHPIG